MANTEVATKRKRGLGRYLRWLGPIILGLLLWRLDDPVAVLGSVGGANWGLIGAASLLNLINIHLKVVRWRGLLRSRDIDYPLGRAWGAFTSALFIGMLTPGRVGDVLRIQYLRHDKQVSYAEGLASVVMDRLCDLYVLVALTAAGVAQFSGQLSNELATFAWVGVAGSALAPLALLIPGLSERVVGVIYRKVSGGSDPDGFNRFVAALRSYVGRALWMAIPLTILTYVVVFAQGWLIGQALDFGGPPPSFIDVAALLAIGNFLGLLPISISGVGIREAFFAALFPALGYAAATGVSFGLLVFIVIYVALTLMGFVSWQIAPPPVGQAPTDTREEAA